MIIATAGHVDHGKTTLLQASMPTVCRKRKSAA